ncbi:MAG: cytochrome c biogenesis protein CcsA [Ignavibacteriales bacterium]|nr:cytochrome c biogenesis protein CcsA [Ignavibacteriales bacterium]
MLFIITVLQYLIPLLYFATAWRYGREFFNNDLRSGKLKSSYLGVSLLLHFVFFILRTAELQHIPVTSSLELLGVIGFTLAGAYIFTEIISHVKNTGFFVLAISSVLVTISSLFAPNHYGMNDVLQSELLAFHIVSALLGYSAFALSAIYGLLYIILYNKLRSKTFDNIYRNLPNLESLESLTFKSTLVGFVALTFVIVVGFIWLPQAFPDISYGDAKVLGTFFIWMLYAIGLAAKKFLGFQGKKIALLSIFGFVITFLSMALSNVISGFHKFY